MKNQKYYRMFEIFFCALRGEAITVKKLAEEYKVSTKSISRDMYGDNRPF